jgi:hypothetical protein
MIAQLFVSFQSLCVCTRTHTHTHMHTQALRLQPYHFGAASGMGLCYVMLKQDAEAVTAFETALSINPGLKNIRCDAQPLPFLRKI